MSLARRPMQSRPHALPRCEERPRAQGDSNANGSATSSPRRSASLCSTTSGYETISAGRCSTAECVPGKRSAYHQINDLILDRFDSAVIRPRGEYDHEVLFRVVTIIAVTKIAGASS